jgi:hypothetical protein
MEYLPCRERVFPYKLNTSSFYGPYLRWLRHLGDRIGLQNTLSLWKDTFANYDDTLLTMILSSEWRDVAPDGDQPADDPQALVAEFFPATYLKISAVEARKIVEETPPILHIKRMLSSHAVEKDMSAYNALHLRFDGLACLAESLIEKYDKQGELVVYDLMIKGRLALSNKQSGSVEEFIEDFIARPDKSNLFTAGLEIDVISNTKREAVLYVRECEWARYFHERHPKVGYLMACSTDEVAYQAFNQSLRLQRTRTLMEGDESCDFKVFAQ